MFNVGDFVYGFLIGTLIAVILLFGIPAVISVLRSLRNLESASPVSSDTPSPPASGAGPPVADAGGETG